MSEVTIIGVDIAKRVFQLHGACANGTVVFRRKLTRARFMSFLTEQPCCIVAMEACATAHDWGCQIEGIGVLSDEFEPVSVSRINRELMRNKVDATQRERQYG